jgi:ParB/RepB/Spo0J family partition protein
VSHDTRLDLIEPDPEQPRKVFDEQRLQELAQSMATNGLAVPILLRPAPEGRYIIVHGERRYRAAQRLGWDSIPAEVRELSSDEAHWIFLVENVQRSELSPIEEARTYQLRLAQGLTQAPLAQRIGKERSYIAQKLRLLTLPAPIIVFLERRALTEGHARQLLKLRQWYGREITATYGERIALDTRPPSDDPKEACIQAAWRAWDAELCAQQFIVPCWEMTAFHWATIAAHDRMNVADLAQELDEWYDSLLARCLAFDIQRQNTGKCDPPRWDDDPGQAKAWWDVWRMLHGAGLLTAVREGRLPPRIRRDAYARFGIEDDDDA